MNPVHPEKAELRGRALYEISIEVGGVRLGNLEPIWNNPQGVLLVAKPLADAGFKLDITRTLFYTPPCWAEETDIEPVGESLSLDRVRDIAKTSEPNPKLIRRFTRRIPYISD